MGPSTSGAVHERLGGMLFSNDEGASWYRLTGGTPLNNIPIADLDQDPANPGVVYVATYGRGVWAFRWGQLPACGGGPQ